MSTENSDFDMNTAPMRIGTVSLKVRDVGTVSAFYQSVLGLSSVDAADDRSILGSGGVPLLELSGDPSLAPNDPNQVGLFHTAFLLPTRGDLARWLNHAAAMRVTLQGASDHNVSEAIYLADPEGNGIEVYVDRPTATWRGTDGEIEMTTERLDIKNLLGAAGDTAWDGLATTQVRNETNSTGPPTCTNSIPERTPLSAAAQPYQCFGTDSAKQSSTMNRPKSCG